MDFLYFVFCVVCLIYYYLSYIFNKKIQKWIFAFSLIKTSYNNYISLFCYYTFNYIIILIFLISYRGCRRQFISTEGGYKHPIYTFCRTLFWLKYAFDSSDCLFLSNQIPGPKLALRLV